MPDAATKTVLFVVAMEQEAMPLVTRFGLERRSPSPFLPGAPFVAWEGTTADGVVLHLVWVGRDPRFGGVNNVATTAAAVATYAAVAAFGTHDLVVSAGTAGGFRGVGAAVGDVYLSSKCVFHSRRIPTDGSGAESYEEYGFGHYRSPQLGALASAAGLKVGVISTSDSLDCTPMDLELMRSEGAAVKEMEAAAVAWVCQTLGVPFVALKAITDIVDGEHATRGEFEANLEIASQALQERAAAVLALLARTPLSGWAAGGRLLPSAPATPSVAATAAAAPPPLAAAGGGGRGGRGGGAASTTATAGTPRWVFLLGVVAGAAAAGLAARTRGGVA